jgi:nucleoid-associated protein YgaU
MHHDKKVGLGLGILLVGIVGAFFFREEPRPRAPLPELQSAESLDHDISESLVDKPKPYTGLEEFEQRYKPFVNLEGIETAGMDETDSGVPPTAGKVFDEEFDFLNDPAATSGKPDEPTLAENQGEGNPTTSEDSPTAQDAIVSRTSTPRELPSAKAMFTEDLSSSEQASARPFQEDDRSVVGENDRNSAGSSAADETATRTYIVQKGDTLSGIASRLLERPIDYRKIFELNRDRLSSPDDLQPGMRLKIPAPEQRPEPTGVSLTAPREAVGSEAPQQNLKSGESPSPKRDRRVIVPRRVRLNEPIANNPSGNHVNRPRVRFKLDEPETECNDDLPTLEGLEPLDLPR